MKLSGILRFDCRKALGKTPTELSDSPGKLWGHELAIVVQTLILAADSLVSDEIYITVVLVDAKDEAAKHFYQSFGFRKGERRRDCVTPAWTRGMFRTCFCTICRRTPRDTIRRRNSTN
jgi:hypothetical protein